MLHTGIIGYPLNFTLSPGMHQRAFAASGIDGVYHTFKIRPEDLEKAVIGIRNLGFRGINVTVPHKETVLSLLDYTDPAAEATGAVNTILFEKNRISGFNTDSPGFISSLSENNVNLSESHILILGTGGAAKACAAGVLRSNPKSFTIAGRNRDKLNSICSRFKAVPADFSNLQQLLMFSDLIINATTEDFSKTVIPQMKSGSCYYDVNYRFQPFFRPDIRYISGISMLIHQGALAFEIWTGFKALPEMKKSLGGL